MAKHKFVKQVIYAISIVLSCAPAEKKVPGEKLCNIKSEDISH